MTTYYGAVATRTDQRHEPTTPNFSLSDCDTRLGPTALLVKDFRFGSPSMRLVRLDDFIRFCAKNTRGKLNCKAVSVITLQQLIQLYKYSRGAGLLSGQSTGLVIERSRVRILAGAAGNFLIQGQLSVLTLISVSVPPPCYRSSM